MPRLRSSLALLLGALLSACSGGGGPIRLPVSITPPAPDPGPQPAPAVPVDTAGVRIVGYYTSWSIATGGPAAVNLPGERLTHVNYAFANLSEDGRAVLGDPCADVGWCTPAAREAGELGGNFADLVRLKRRHPHLRTLISIGGWTWSERFSDAALSEASRQRLVESTLDLFLRRWPGLFDGVDIDWEYPVGGGRPENVTRPEDRRNFTLLLAEFRRQLDAQGARDGRRYLLTIAAPAGPGTMANLELDRIHPFLDWINVMTYDYHTGGRIAHFNAPLFAAVDDPTPRLTVHATLQAYLSAGVPREKVVMGVPFFGYGFGGVPPQNQGLFQPAAGAAEGTWGVGSVDFRALTGRDLASAGFQRHWHETAKVPWLYNPQTGVWISYDDVRSLQHKADYVREHRLGGVMIWELSADDGTLLPALHTRLVRGGG